MGCTKSSEKITVIDIENSLRKILKPELFLTYRSALYVFTSVFGNYVIQHTSSGKNWGYDLIFKDISQPVYQISFLYDTGIHIEVFSRKGKNKCVHVGRYYPLSSKNYEKDIRKMVLNPRLPLTISIHELS